MNNLFKKNKAIELDENYSLETDKENGVILVFQEKRLKQNKITREKEPFIFIDKWFFLTAGQALETYVELSSNSIKKLYQIVDNSNKVLLILEEFKSKFKNWD
jgi:hypothetical protein